MSGPEYLIWSNQHRAWWRPNSQGYTERLSEAGRYSREFAVAIGCEALPGDADQLRGLPEIPVRLEDVEEMRADFRARYSDVPREAWE